MKKSTLIIVITVVLALIIGLVIYFKQNRSPVTTYQGEPEPELPINVLALSERPFVTLTPDSTGRKLDLSISGMPNEGELEYEFIYDASGKQEGVIGGALLDTATDPLLKNILLGSKSGGGKISYHEGVTGGSLTLTYNETRLKESWNYLHFDPKDPIFSSTDGRFSVTLPSTALKDQTVIITMKTFGYPKDGLPDEASVVSGPYGYFAQTSVKGNATVELMLPAGEHTDPTLFAWDGKTWTKLAAKIDGDTLSATSTAQVFLVTTQ